MIPSLTPKKYKASNGVTIGAYKALFEIRNELEHLPPEKYNIPTLIICDRHDELVSPQGLQKFIEQKKLTRWQLQIFKSSLWKHVGRKHLMVAREYQSDAYWNHLKACMDAFLYE
jgi:esterase/lipase